MLSLSLSLSFILYMWVRTCELNGMNFNDNRVIVCNLQLKVIRATSITIATKFLEHNLFIIVIHDSKQIHTKL